MKKRNFVNTLLDRLSEKTPLIQVIVGPRQVGKSTGIKQVLNNQGVYFTADSPVPIHFSEIEALWSEAMQLEKPILAIDEVQKISGWSEVIKKLWDTKEKPIYLMLSGSAALAIEKKLKESLAGRYELIRVEHWNFSEAQDVFSMSVKDFIEYGCYPGAQAFKKELDRWGLYVRDSIIEPAISRDLLQLQPVEQPALLRQLFSVCVGHPSQIVSLNKIQGQLQDKKSLATLQNYLELLSHGFLVTGLQKFSRNAVRTKSSPPKLIIHDNSLIRCFEKPIQQDIPNTRLGFYLENAVGARLIESGWDTFYWKDRKLEVDFITIGPLNQKWAIEVKTSKPKKEDLIGLFTFCELNPEFTPCVACLEEVRIDGIKYLSIDELLKMNRNS